VANAGWASQDILGSIERFTVRTALWPLLTGEVIITHVDLQLESSGAKIGVQGTMMEPLSLRGLKLHVSADIPDASQYSPIIPEPAYSYLKGHLSGGENRTDTESPKGSASAKIKTRGNLLPALANTATKRA
jgi:hypothetical protein